MKHAIYCLCALIVLASCSDNDTAPVSNNVPNLYFEGKDTLITDSCKDYMVKDVTYKTCSGDYRTGKRLIANGVTTKSHIVMTEGKPVPQDSISKWFSTTTASTASSSSDDWGWLWTLLKWIAALVGLAIACWLAWWIFTALLRNTPSSTATSSSASAQAATAAPVTAGTAVQPATPPSQATLVALTALSNSISAGGGGHITMAGFSIQLNGVDSPLVYVENSSGGHSGDINLQIGDSLKVKKRTDRRSGPSTETKP